MHMQKSEVLNTKFNNWDEVGGSFKLHVQHGRNKLPRLLHPSPIDYSAVAKHAALGPYSVANMANK